MIENIDFHRVPASNCPHCGHRVNAMSSLEEKVQAPQVDDFTVCISCAEILGFNLDLTVRPLIFEDVLVIARDPKLREMLAKAQAAIREVNASRN